MVWLEPFFNVFFLFYIILYLYFVYIFICVAFVGLVNTSPYTYVLYLVTYCTRRSKETNLLLRKRTEGLFPPGAPPSAPLLGLQALSSYKSYSLTPSHTHTHFVSCLFDARLADHSPCLLIHSSIRCSHVYMVTRSCTLVFVFFYLYAGFVYGCLCNIHVCLWPFFLGVVNLRVYETGIGRESLLWLLRKNSFFCLRSLAARKHCFPSTIAAKESTQRQTQRRLILGLCHLWLH